MASTVFTPLLNQFTITLSTTTVGGGAMPPGEVESSVTIGIRPDGNTSFGPGNYQYQIIVAAPATAETLAQLNSAISGGLPPGNYWAAAQQTDTYNGKTFTSSWETPEVPFSIPLPGVAPAAPSLSVS